MEAVGTNFSDGWLNKQAFYVITAILIFSLTIILRLVFVKFFDRFIAKKTKELNNNPTNYKFLKHSISAIIYVVGFSFAIYAIPALRTMASSLLAGAGILTVAIGFASQQAFSNIVSGIFIIIFKPFKVNDRIQVKDSVLGIVEDITLRHTIIRNFENRRIVIPNSVISQESLVNSDIIEDKICKVLDLGISYDSDVKKARQIIQEEASKHPFFLDNRSEEQKAKEEHPIIVRVTSWAESAIQLRVWIWAENASSAYILGCDLYESIKERFDKEGIEIPFPHRTLILKNNKILSEEKE